MSKVLSTYLLGSKIWIQAGQFTANCLTIPYSGTAPAGNHSDGWGQRGRTAPDKVDGESDEPKKRGVVVPAWICSSNESCGQG